MSSYFYFGTIKKDGKTILDGFDIYAYTAGTGADMNAFGWGCEQVGEFGPYLTGFDALYKTILKHGAFTIALHPTLALPYFNMKANYDSFRIKITSGEAYPGTTDMGEALFNAVEVIEIPKLTEKNRPKLKTTLLEGMLKKKVITVDNYLKKAASTLKFSGSPNSDVS